MKLIKRKGFNWKQLFVFLTLIFALCSLFPIVSSVRKRKQIRLKAAELLQGEYVPDEILVKFKPPTTPQKKQSLHQKYKGHVKGIIPELDIEVVKIEKAPIDGLSDYLGDENVEFAEPNYILHATLIPNDPHYSLQWALPKIKAPEAWDIDTGSANVTVAVIDTGADVDHPDLAAKLVAGKSFVKYTDSSDDDNGHGTHMAGIIAAMTDNSEGVAGVSWETKIMPLKAFNEKQEATVSDIVPAISYASSQKAKIINLSVSTEQFSQTFKNAIDYAWNKNVLIVASVGNLGDKGNPLSYPAAFSNVIAVSVTDQNDRHPSFSSYGSYVDVAAPGVGILSTFVGNGYASSDGASASSAFVSGLAALVWSQNLNLTNQKIKSIIEESVDDIGPLGKDDYFGFGRINAHQAIVTATPSPTPEGVSLTFKIKFQGITQQRPNKTVRVLLKKDDDVAYTFENVGVSSEADGVYSGTIDNVDPDTYNVFIKGWAHLEKKFADVTLNEGENTKDWSTMVLLTGDSEPNNKIDIFDYNKLVEHFGPRMPAEGSPADFDLDGDVDIFDYNFLVGNFGKIGD